MVELYHPELRGVIVGETELCSLDDGLLYRGYDATDLAYEGSFEETVHLLLVGESLPTAEDLSDLRSLLVEAASPSPAVDSFYDSVPIHLPIGEALRTAVSLLGHDDWQPPGSDAGLSQAIRLVAQVPTLIEEWLCRRDGRPRLGPCATRAHAGNVFAQLVGREPAPEEERAVDAMLTLTAEHELTVATFAARVAASTGADLYAAIVAALAAFSGPEALPSASRWVDRLPSITSREQAEAWVQTELERTPRPPGFGHPVFQVSDPRAAVLEQLCELVCRRSDTPCSLEAQADALEQAVWRACQLPPNIEWPRRRLLRYMNIDDELTLPLFLCGRIVGWTAHVLEQRREGTSYRPRARYRGAGPLRYVALDRR